MTETETDTRTCTPQRSDEIVSALGEAARTLPPDDLAWLWTNKIVKAILESQGQTETVKASQTNKM